MVEAKPIEVESYANIAFNGAWKSRSRAMWGVAFVGLLIGAAIGIAAPFFPVIVASLSGVQGVAVTGLTILKAMAVFGATGMATGMVGGVMVGSSAGGVSAVAKEMELRERLHEQEVGQVLGVNMPPHQYIKPIEPEQNYFNPSVSALFAGFGAVAGFVMAAAFLSTSTITSGVVVSSALGSAAIPALGVVLGSVAATPLAVTACFVGVMACFGAIFGINVPKLATELQDFTGKLLSGELLGSSWEKEPARNVQLEPQILLEKQPKNIALEYHHNEELPTNHAEKYARKPAISYGELAKSLNSESNLVHSH